jgi:hypothetical protein
MKQKPRVPEESRKRLGSTESRRYLLPNDGSERRPMCTCESSMKRTSGRFTEWAREPRLPKPENLSVNSVDRGGGCAGDVSFLTRGGPLGWTTDNYDRVDRREAGRWIDALRGVRRTHSSRKTTCRRRSWRHGQRIKQVESTGRREDPCPSKDEGGNTETCQSPLRAGPNQTKKNEQPTERQRKRIFPRAPRAWSLNSGRKRKEARWNN